MTRLWFENALLPGGWSRAVRIVVEHGRIARVDPDTSFAAGDERHALAVPGLPNLHSHAFQRAMAGLAEVRGPGTDTFWTWREVMYRTLDRMDPDDMQAIASLAYVEMLESGFTRVGEFHYVHHDRDGTPHADIGELASRIAAAAQDTGIALTLLPVFYAHGNFGGLPPTHGQRRFLNDPARFARLVEASAAAIAPLPDAVLGIAPHSLRAATPEEIAAILPLAAGGPVHIHVAEQVKEVEDCLAATGRRPVERLYDIAPVDDRWCLIHATHMTPEETAMVARSGAVAGLCPITEANLGDGIFPGAAFAAAGGRYGVGTDSNVLIDAAGELRQLEYAQRLGNRARNVMAPGEGRSTGQALFEAALSGGAQALGASPLGAPAGLAAGNPADIVGLDPARLFLEGKAPERALDALIFAAARGAVDTVWRGGTKLVEAGRHRARSAVEARYHAAMARLAL